MKKLLLVLTLLISYGAFGQTKIRLLDPNRQAKLNGITGISVVIGQDDTIRVTQPGGALQYLRSNATNDTLEWATISGGGAIDTTDITNFYVKVRSLFSSKRPVIYDFVNGIFSVDTTSSDGLFTIYDGLSKLNISDTTAMLAPYARLLTMAATYQPLDADLTAIAALTPTNDDFIQRKSGAWTNRSISQIKGDIAFTLNDVTIYGNSSTAGITVGNGDIGLNSSGSRGVISLRHNTFYIDLSPLDLTSSALLRIPAKNDTLSVRGDFWAGMLNTSLGSANQLIRVNSGGTAVEFFTPSYITTIDTSTAITGLTTLYQNGLKKSNSDSTNSISGYTTLYQNSLKKNNSDSTNSISGYTTLYQNSLKLSIADTTAMLSHYADSISTWNAFKLLSSKSTGDQSTTSLSLIDITNLGIPIGANETVYFRAVLKVGASATNGVGYAVTIPTGATMLVNYSGQNAATVSQAAPSWLTTSGSAGSNINILAVATMVTVFEGWVTASSTAGTIQLQGRTANASNTVTWYAGSFITGHKQ